MRTGSILRWGKVTLINDVGSTRICVLAGEHGRLTNIATHADNDQTKAYANDWASLTAMSVELRFELQWRYVLDLYTQYCHLMQWETLQRTQSWWQRRELHFPRQYASRADSPSTILVPFVQNLLESTYFETLIRRLCENALVEGSLSGPDSICYHGYKSNQLIYTYMREGFKFFTARVNICEQCCTQRAQYPSCYIGSPERDAYCDSKHYYDGTNRGR